MRSTRSILSVRFTAVGGPSSVRRAVGGFLRYIQQNDHQWTNERPGGVEGFLRYAAHRDRTMPQGRLFGADGDVGEHERRQLGRFVTRSVEGRTAGRAYYRLIISPEDAQGLDLRKVTRSVMTQLSRDAGSGELPPWIGAEHRNTAHPHVHVVMAANRQLPDGRYRTLVINRERLARMKISMAREIYRERGHEFEPNQRRFEEGRGWPSLAMAAGQGGQRVSLQADGVASHTRGRRQSSQGFHLGAALRRLASRYRYQMERDFRERLLQEEALERLRALRQRGHGREMDR